MPQTPIGNQAIYWVKHPHRFADRTKEPRQVNISVASLDNNPGIFANASTEIYSLNQGILQGEVSLYH
jgi:hypothetical protein